ncbi:MAG TPA: response regulator, partial [Kiritimatiellia bacterium]|nr:response regulator [Kiritimatiellia bacterium]
QVLSDSGHAVEELDSGSAFKERWRKNGARPDLIIMDFSMPEYNGLQLCEWLKGEGGAVPVILVSGFAATQPDIAKALRLKRTFFLQKPFSFREMTDVVTVALGETLIGE